LDHLDVQFAAFRNPQTRELIAGNPERFVAHVAGHPGIAADPGELAVLIKSQVPLAPVVYGPAGIGGHPDHRSLAQATIGLAAPECEVRPYADSPYYLAYGLPGWLGGKSNPEADACTEQALSSLDLSSKRLVRQVCELGEPMFHRKLAAIRRYETEIPSIWADVTRSPGGPESLRYETYWTVSDAGQ
jgi:LmbE family N-acetylglucosaminyl deacetylase